jgi:GDPmannose 4,6-dehydratase
MKKALIFGITGQDGSYLAKLLLEKNYKVFGTSRTFSPKKINNLRTVGINSKIHKIKTNFASNKSIQNAIHLSKPDEIYNLAGVSSVLDPFKNPIEIAKINGLAVLQILETIRIFYPKIKFFQASSSEMFAPTKGLISENSQFDPQTPYATSKVFAHEMTQQYRKNFQLFTCCGILFNHESPLRGLEFVTRKITNSMIKIKNNKMNKLILGNIDVERDWGFAGDYVVAMWKMLQISTPSDFVIATGKSHSVRDFLIKSSNLCGINNWNDVVQFSSKLNRSIDYQQKIGDFSKAKKFLKWTPKTNFNKLIKLMIDAEFTN